MKKLILMAQILLFSFSATAQDQFEQDGVILPRTLSFEKTKLELNGFGTRSKLWVDVYVQALYLTRLSQDPKEILEGDITMAVRLQILSELVTSSKLSKSLNKGLRKSVGDEMMLKLKTEIDALEKLLTSEITKKDDAFNLIYNPNDKAIWVYKNDVLRGKIPGFEFKKAFFGIWLSDNPVDEKLKNDLLGKY
jgi:Chalcone isomerase-like